MQESSAPPSEDPLHAGELLLLKGITGSFRPGVLTALMGASGAGVHPAACRNTQLFVLFSVI